MPILDQDALRSEDLAGQESQNDAAIRKATSLSDESILLVLIQDELVPASGL